MESPIKSSTLYRLKDNLAGLGNTLIQQFSLDNFSQHEDTSIMPLSYVESLLHRHYVNLEPLLVEIEYYDEMNRIQEITLLVRVLSTIDDQHRILLEDQASQNTFKMDVQQILRVSANIA